MCLDFRLKWSATREDLFPEDMCLYLGRLHDRAPEHSYSQTRKAVLENLGRPIEDIFVDFPKRPCASGSIAQVCVRSKKWFNDLV